MPKKRKQQSTGVTGQKQTPSGVRVRVEWQERLDLPVTYANHLWLERDQDGQIVLTFGRQQLPFGAMGQGLMNKLKAKGVQIVPVARVSVTPASLKRMVEVIGPFLTAGDDMSKQATEERRS